MYRHANFLLILLANVCDGLTVSVRCEIDTMQISVGFDERFHGRLILRPNNDCYLDGEGRRFLLFSISLQAALTERCSVIQMENEYVGILEVQMNKNLIVSSDQYLVSCPIRINLPPNSIQSPKRTLNMPIKAELSVVLPSTIGEIGQTYPLNIVFYNEIGMPSVRIGRCLAFLYRLRLDAVELTDINGCTKTPQLSQDFKWTNNWQNLQTNIEMFNATNDHYFFLQCQLRRCASECEPTVCDPRVNDGTDVDYNAYFVVSTRVDVMQPLSPPLSLSSSNSQKSEKTNICFEGFCPENNIVFIAIISLILLSILISCVVACFVRTKCLRINSTSTASTPNQLESLNKIITNLNDSKRNSRVGSQDNLNVDELIKENYELKLRTLLQQFSCNLSSNTVSSSLSLVNNNNEQFMSLDSLPDPPSISIEEIRQLNQAFNKIESSLPKEDQISERSNSFESLSSCSSNTTLDINASKRPISRCSTVDVGIKTKQEFMGHSKLKITSLKSLTQRPISVEDDDLKKADEKLNYLLNKKGSHNWLNF